MVVLKTNNLTKTYRNDIVLSNVNVEINKGEIYAFIGENGAGKTTFMRIITGLTFKNSGDFSLFGKTDEKEIMKMRKRLGCMVEGTALYPDMSARENIEVQRKIRGIPGKTQIDEVLNLVKIHDTGKKKVKNFSLGMRQRLGLAIALIGEPEFLILDEPVNGLDPVGIVEFRELLKKLNVERNLTILISSHILTELHQLATNYGIIHKGKLVEQITSCELDERCKKHIKLKVDNVAKATNIIELNLKTQKYDVYPDNIIKLYDYLDNVKTVSFELSTNGVIIENINLTGDDLESYFLKIIGGQNNV